LTDMLVAFHLVAIIVNEFLTPEWQKNVRDARGCCRHAWGWTHGL